MCNKNRSENILFLILKRIRYKILIIILFCIVGFYLIAYAYNKISLFELKISGTDICYNVCGEVLESDELIKAEEIVKKFMGDNYVSPKSVKLIEIESNEEIYGFQDGNIIYLNKNLDKNEMLKTMVHELLHLQNPDGFDVQFYIGLKKVKVGHNFSEAIVEAITCQLLHLPKTNRVILLEKSIKNPQFFIDEFKQNSSTQVWKKYFNNENIYELEKDKKKYFVEEYIYFLNSFDFWMIGEKKAF